MNTKVYSIVVTYNGAKWIQKCFSSLVESKVDGVHKILVVDNGSKDDTIQILKKDYPEVIIIETGKNLGFGQANNIGIEKAIANDADFVFLLNQDAWIDSNTIQGLIEINKINPGYGIISPLHLNGEGDLIDKNVFEFIKESINSREILSHIFFKNKQNVVEIDFINAAIWLISAEVIKKVGVFDSVFYHYGEDKNYISRVKYHKYLVGLAINLVGYHDREQVVTTKRTNKRYLTLVKADALHFLCDINKPSLFSGFIQFTFEHIKRSIYNLVKLKPVFSIIDIYVYFYCFSKISSIRNSIKFNKLNISNL